MAPKCHEFFGCKRLDCIMCKNGEGKNCWDVEPTCNPSTETFANSLKLKNKMGFCKKCLFYEHVNEISYEMRFEPLKGINKI